jgi:phosphatidate cytidylyltransferase
LNEFLKRTLTGAMFVVIMLVAVIWNSISLFVLLLLVSSLALFEFYSIFKSRIFKALSVTGIISGILILSIVYLTNQNLIPIKYIYLLIVPVTGILFTFLFIDRDDLMDSMMIAITGLLYIVFPLTLIFYLTENPLTMGYRPQILLGTLIIIWTYDTMAYLTGILIGRHKLAPRLSPKKSWEGLTGGTLSAILITIILTKYFTLLHQSDWIILSVIIVLSSTAGDLFESLLKREAGLKDSGRILPGHGGILDRFDSLFFAVPFVFLYIYIIKL